MEMTITLCFSIVLLGNSVALTHDTPTDASTIPPNRVPPLLFPEDSSQYRIITQNETAIQHILQITSKDDVIREIPLTEGMPSTVEMNNQATTDQNQTTEKVETSSRSTTTTRSEEKKEVKNGSVEEDSINDDDDYDNDETTENPKDEVERIQSDGKYQTSEEIEEQFNRNDGDKKSPEIVDIEVDYTAEMDHTHIVAIIAVVTIAILAFAVYFGLIYWRYQLQKKYGSRQRLVTEEDWYHQNDSRDFEI
ncbi:hypothetical protein DMENIID0001_075020 [Sergentomyia squamirostris]